MTTEHAVCCIHGVDEPFISGVSYRACGECWHVWQTENDFRADILAALPEGEPPRARPLSEEWVCPLCAHDL